MACMMQPLPHVNNIESCIRKRQCLPESVDDDCAQPLAIQIKRNRPAPNLTGSVRLYRCDVVSRLRKCDRRNTISSGYVEYRLEAGHMTIQEIQGLMELVTAGKSTTIIAQIIGEVRIKYQVTVLGIGTQNFNCLFPRVRRSNVAS